MKQAACAAGALFLMGAGSPLPAAAATAWASVGAGCVPIAQTTQAALHLNTAGKAKFAASKTGEIVFTCAITAPLPGAYALTLSYADPDGANFQARVTATLRRMNRNSGAVASIASIDSNTSAGTSYRLIEKSLVSGCLGYTFDHSVHDYYVQVSVARTTTSFDPVFGAVSLLAGGCVE